MVNSRVAWPAPLNLHGTLHTGAVLAKLVRRSRTLADERQSAHARDNDLILQLSRALTDRVRQVVPSQDEAKQVATRVVEGLRPIRQQWRRSDAASKMSGKRTVLHWHPGRPRDFRRRVLLVTLAGELERAGVQPTKSDDGIFAKFARVILPSFDLTVPRNIKKLFPDIEYAVDAHNAQKITDPPQ